MKSFLIFGQDNGEYAYDHASAFKCSGCGVIDRNKSKRQKFDELTFDISYTLDNELLISERIFVELSKYLDSSNFEKSENYYYVIPRKTVKFNFEKRKVKFGEKCNFCGNPSHAIGISPPYLNHEIDVAGIYSTDICFGDVEDSGRNITPGIIVSEDVLDKILALKPTGVGYERTSC